MRTIILDRRGRRVFACSGRVPTACARSRGDLADGGAAFLHQFAPQAGRCEERSSRRAALDEDAAQAGGQLLLFGRVSLDVRRPALGSPLSAALREELRWEDEDLVTEQAEGFEEMVREAKRHNTERRARGSGLAELERQGKRGRKASAPKRVLSDDERDGARPRRKGPRPYGERTAEAILAEIQADEDDTV